MRCIECGYSFAIDLAGEGYVRSPCPMCHPPTYELYEIRPNGRAQVLRTEIATEDEARAMAVDAAGPGAEVTGPCAIGPRIDRGPDLSMAPGRSVHWRLTEHAAQGPGGVEVEITPTRSPGRPRKPEGEALSVVVRFRATPDEYAELKRRAEAAGSDVATLVRAVLWPARP